MKASFFVEDEYYNQTKELIRKHGLYFVCNPLQLPTEEWAIDIEGDVEDYNKFSKDFTKLKDVVFRYKSHCENHGFPMKKIINFVEDNNFYKLIGEKGLLYAVKKVKPFSNQPVKVGCIS